MVGAKRENLGSVLEWKMRLRKVIWGWGCGGRESRRAPGWYIKVAPEREIDLLWAPAAKWGRPGRDMKES